MGSDDHSLIHDIWAASAYVSQSLTASTGTTVTQHLLFNVITNFIGKNRQLADYVGEKGEKALPSIFIYIQNRDNFSRTLQYLFKNLPSDSYSNMWNPSYRSLIHAH
jgi:hypothetical protein